MCCALLAQTLSVSVSWLWGSAVSRHQGAHPPIRGAGAMLCYATWVVQCLSHWGAHHPIRGTEPLGQCCMNRPEE